MPPADVPRCMHGANTERRQRNPVTSLSGFRAPAVSPHVPAASETDVPFRANPQPSKGSTSCAGSTASRTASRSPRTTSGVPTAAALPPSAASRLCVQQASGAVCAGSGAPGTGVTQTYWRRGLASALASRSTGWWGNAPSPPPNASTAAAAGRPHRRLVATYTAVQLPREINNKQKRQ